MSGSPKSGHSYPNELKKLNTHLATLQSST
jgi:hypothetical protein